MKENEKTTEIIVEEAQTPIIENASFTKKLKNLDAKKLKMIGIGFAVVIILAILCFCIMSTFALFKGIGSGTVVSEERTISDFNKIQLDGNIKVILLQGRNESVRVEAEDNLIGRVSTTKKGDTLRIGTKKSFPFIINKLFPRKDINVYVTVKSIDSINISGSGEIKSNELTVDTLYMNISGSGKVEISSLRAFETQGSISGSGEIILKGQTNSQIINISGSGKYLSDEFESKSSNVDISGSGETSVYVLDEMDIKISGSGTVKYKGDPRLNQSISGSGKIERL